MRSLQQEPEELAAVFQSLELSPDPVFVTDRSNRIVFWNDAARLLLGFTAEEAVGALCTDLLHGCDTFGNRYCSDNCPIMQMANRSETVRKFNLTVGTKERTPAMLDVSILQLRAGRLDDYFLAHILRSSDTRSNDEVRSAAEDSAPPRPRLVAARESADIRIRKLTSREVEVLAMLAAGRNTPEIADRLHISQLTARSHIQNILEKLEVHSKAEAVAFAFQKNLI
ncbi:MAG TPA: LuxR C-terminal-related transcriptional regulator [Thermoanaerobaculia bacterium]|nr:LuxR C-terminal-related transcriptional regulator [Thermoanaerobaculia bacterium]